MTSTIASGAPAACRQSDTRSRNFVPARGTCLASLEGITSRDAVMGYSDALFADLYELTMLQAYFEERMTGRAVFSLFVRRLPAQRNFLLACGLDDVLAFLERLRSLLQEH